MLVGKSITIKSAQTVKRVSIAEPAIADFILISPHEIYLTGKSAGVTNLTLCQDGKILSVYDLDVSYDSSTLKQKLAALFPEDKDLNVFSAGSSITLSGRISSTSNLSQALSLAESFAPKGNVKNLVEEAGIQQVMLEVRVAEISKRLLKQLGVNFTYTNNNDFAAGFVNNLLPTVKGYYQLLEDMFIGFRVTAFSGSPRKSLLSTERFFFFDLGVRNAAAELPLGAAAVRANPGPLFEQWVVIELWKRLQYLGGAKLHYQRTKAGAEVDFIVARGAKLVPIEVKWTERPAREDTRHLRAFLDDHPRQAPRGYVVCRCREPLALDDRITALPLSCL